MLLKKEDLFSAKLNCNNGIIIDATVRYVDEKECYISTHASIDYNTIRNATGHLSLCAQNGCYEINVKIVNITFSLAEVVLQLNFLKKDVWKFIERRKGRRKDVSLPVRIVYSDQVLSQEIKRLSESGFSFIIKEEINPAFKHIPCEVIINFSKYPELGIENNEMQLKAKLIRIYRYQGNLMASYKFTLIFPIQINTIRTLLSKV